MNGHMDGIGITLIAIVLLSATQIARGQEAIHGSESLDVKISKQLPHEQLTSFKALLDKAQADHISAARAVLRLEGELATNLTTERREVVRARLNVAKELSASSKLIRDRRFHDTDRARTAVAAIEKAPENVRAQIISLYREIEKTRLEFEAHVTESHAWEKANYGRDLLGTERADARARFASRGAAIWEKISGQQKAIRSLGGAYPLTGVGSAALRGTVVGNPNAVVKFLATKSESFIMRGGQRVDIKEGHYYSAEELRKFGVSAKWIRAIPVAVTVAAIVAPVASVAATEVRSVSVDGAPPKALSIAGSNVDSSSDLDHVIDSTASHSATSTTSRPLNVAR